MPKENRARLNNFAACMERYFPEPPAEPAFYTMRSIQRHRALSTLQPHPSRTSPVENIGARYTRCGAGGRPIDL
jgi:hypothetical protein